MRNIHSLENKWLNILRGLPPVPASLPPNRNRGVHCEYSENMENKWMAQLGTLSIPSHIDVHKSSKTDTITMSNAETTTHSVTMRNSDMAANLEEDDSSGDYHSSEGELVPVFRAWEAIWAFIVAGGTSRLSREQLNSTTRILHIASTMQTGKDSVRLPSWTRLRQFMGPSCTFSPLIPVHSIRPRICEERNPLWLTTGEEDDDVLYIKPSSFVRRDIADHAFSEWFLSSWLIAHDQLEMKRMGFDHVPIRECLDEIPIVRARHLFYAERRAFHVRNKSNKFLFD